MAHRDTKHYGMCLMNIGYKQYLKHGIDITYFTDAHMDICQCVCDKHECLMRWRVKSCNSVMIWHDTTWYVPNEQ